MRPQLIIKTIESLYPIRRTLCIEGPPGVGKTAIVREAAKRLGIDYIEMHLPTMPVEDFGVPDMSTSDTTFDYKLPRWFPQDPNSSGILCFDDRNQAGADMQKVLANICQARNLHGHMLPAGWMVVSTGNRATDRAGANRVLSHLRNRETVIEFDAHLDDWSKWALDNGVRPEVVSFLRFKTEHFNGFKAENDINPTPRSWTEGVSAIIDVVPKEAEYDCICGAVGKGAAAEFAAYLKVYRELPDMDDIIEAPATYKLPTEMSVKYAIVTSLEAKADSKNIDAILTYVKRLDPEFGTLFAMLIAMSVSREHKRVSLMSNRAFLDFLNQHSYYLSSGA